MALRSLQTRLNDALDEYRSEDRREQLSGAGLDKVESFLEDRRQALADLEADPTPGQDFYEQRKRLQAELAEGQAALDDRQEEVRDLLLEDFGNGTMSYEAVQDHSRRLFDGHPERGAEVTVGLWGQESERNAAQPFTDPRYLLDSKQLVDVLEAEEDVYKGFHRVIKDLSIMAPEALQAREDIARLEQDILDAQRARLGEADPLERRRLDQVIQEKEEDLRESSAILSEYSEKAKDLSYLRSAGSLARLVENLGAEAAQGVYVDMGGTILRNAGAAATVALHSRNPIIILVSAGVGALGGAAEAFVKRLITNEDALMQLPELLKTDPQAAIDFMASVASTEQWLKVASYLLSGGNVLYKLGKEGARGLIEGVAEETAEEGIKQILD